MPTNLLWTLGLQEPELTTVHLLEVFTTNSYKNHAKPGLEKLTKNAQADNPATSPWDKNLHDRGLQVYR
jgi:hypothetical protein